MTGKYTPIQLPEQKGFKVDVHEDEILVIQVGKDFDSMVRNSSWAATIVEHYFGPFSEVVIDLGKVPTITSTVIAGLVHFADFYSKQCPDRFYLANPSERIVKILDMMKLRPLFTIRKDWSLEDDLDNLGDVKLSQPDWLG